MQDGFFLYGDFSTTTGEVKIIFIHPIFKDKVASFLVYRPLVFLVIPRSPKTRSQTLPLSNIFQVKFHFHFRSYNPWL